MSSIGCVDNASTEITDFYPGDLIASNDNSGVVIMIVGSLYVGLGVFKLRILYCINDVIYCYLIQMCKGEYKHWRTIMRP